MKYKKKGFKVNIQPDLEPTTWQLIDCALHTRELYIAECTTEATDLTQVQH